MGLGLLLGVSRLGDDRRDQDALTVGMHVEALDYPLVDGLGRQHEEGRLVLLCPADDLSCLIPLSFSLPYRVVLDNLEATTQERRVESSTLVHGDRVST